MSKPIKVGDLVAVIKGLCCNDQFVGKIFTVGSIESHAGRCFKCNKQYGTRPLAMVDDSYGFDLGQLKRIGDFPELADERHDVEITA